MTTYAQTTPADCVSGCTSNDIQIENAYLSDEFGNPLDSNFVCENGQDAIVYLTLELSTNTPRVGVSIYTKIKELDLGVPRGTLDSMSQCFGDTLNQPLNRVTFNQTLSWPCGTAIALTDVYIAWGTGNKNFCEGEAFQCPKTPSKCFSLPGGDYIAVEIPTAKNFSYESCPDVPGGTTATFNLRSLDTLVTKSTDVNIEWYKDFATDSLISIPESYTTKSAEEDVYAKVTSTIPPYPSSVATVALIVYPSPTVTLTDPSDVCFDGSAMSFEGSPKPNQGISGVFSTNAPAESFTDKGDGTASLDPSVAGVGTFEVIYTFTDTNGCLEDDTVSVEVFDNPVAPTDAVPVTVCENGEEQTLTATATVPDGDTIIWYSAPTGGDEVYPPALVSAVADTLILYGETVNKLTLCTSLDRTPDTLIINPAPAAPINPVNVTECETGEEQTLTATATVPDGVSIVWYDAETNGNVVDPASLVSTVADTLILYGEAVDDLTACKSLSRTADTLIINPAPAAPINPVNVTECETGEEQTLTATATVPDGVSIVWYDAETNGNVADPASLVSTVADTLILYGEAVDDLTGCKSLSRTADTLIINPAPAAPKVVYNPPACDDSTFSVTITNVVKDATYTIKDKNGDDIPGVFPGNSIVAVNESDTSFSNIPAGSGYKVTVQIGDCISLSADSCGLPTKSATIAQVVKSTPITQTVKSAAIGENLNSEFSVKAYPNPFSDQVKFEVNVPEESNGSLELFNMLGQKVKIIHQGHMNAGINTFEVSLSGQQSTTLIYRLKAGDKQLTGKLLQVKQ